MKKINLLAFNYGYGNFTNGPGISCWNFSKFCINDYNIFTKLYSDLKTKNISEYIFDDTEYIHWWSGLDNNFLDIVKKEKKLGKKIIVGPNLIDGTSPYDEIKLCNEIQPDLILVVNKEIKFNLKKYLKYNIEEFMTGPDYDLWVPSNEYENIALWKGNSTHISKNFKMAIELKKKLVDKMKIIGYPYLYKYIEHVPLAGRYATYICTSLSETKSEAALEQMAAGVPVIANPRVFMMGEHYKTGIIVNDVLEEYLLACNKILNDSSLRKDLSYGAREFILSRFNKEKLDEYYTWLLNEY